MRASLSLRVKLGKALAEARGEERDERDERERGGEIGYFPEYTNNS